MRGDVLLVLGADLVEGAIVNPGEHLVGGQPHPRERLPDDCTVLQVTALVVTRRKQCPVRGGEQIRIFVADDDASPQGEDPGVLLGLLPDGGLSLLHVRLPQREREKGDVPVGTGRETNQNVFMCVAGERATVIPGNREGDRIHVAGNTRAVPGVPAETHGCSGAPLPPAPTAFHRGSHRSCPWPLSIAGGPSFHATRLIGYFPYHDGG